MYRYICILIVSLLVTFPLTSIDGFTIWAWLSVAILVSISHSNRVDSAENLSKATSIICDRIDTLTSLIKRNGSSVDAVNQEILSELEKIRKTVRHEAKK